MRVQFFLRRCSGVIEMTICCAVRIVYLKWVWSVVLYNWNIFCFARYEVGGRDGDLYQIIQSEKGVATSASSGLWTLHLTEKVSSKILPMLHHLRIFGRRITDSSLEFDMRLQIYIAASWSIQDQGRTEQRYLFNESISLCICWVLFKLNC